MHKTSPSFDSPVRSYVREHAPIVLIELLALAGGLWVEMSARMLVLLVTLLALRYGLLGCVATYRVLQRRGERVRIEPAPITRDAKTSPYDSRSLAQAVEAVMVAKKNLEEPRTKLTEQ